MKLLQNLKVIMILTMALAMPARLSAHTNHLDELLGMFGWDLESTPITTEEVADGLYVLFGIGGNIAVSVGEDGVLIVDDQFPEMVPKIEEAIKAVGGGTVDYVVNTHWHFDHAEGNNALGPKGATIVAHRHARRDMAQGGEIDLVLTKYQQQPYPKAALPTLTYNQGMQIHFNDGAIDLLHFSPAHTDGDTAVIFRKQNAIHLGDVFNNTGYPFVDVGSGGGIDGMINFCEQALQSIDPDTIVIPGHGPVTNVETLERYVDMLKTVRQRVADMIDQGLTLEEVVAAKPTQDLDEIYGPESASLGFVNRVYTSLAE